MSIISIGTFDGIHRGHRHVIERVKDLARKHHTRSVIISFKDHPAYTLGGGNMPPLLCPSRLKQAEIMKMGIDEVELLDFTESLAQTSAEDFLVMIVDRWQPEIIVVGYDSHFGAGRRGNRDFLEANATRYGYQVAFVEPLIYKGKPVSSSTIRSLLVKGELDEASILLDRRYKLVGKVVHGLGQGTGFGFPTANIALENPRQLIPKEGLYLSSSKIDGNKHFGLTNIGKSPTVKSDGIIEVETFFIDYEGDLYERYLEIELIKYLREEKMFADKAELISAMHEDLERARNIIGKEMQ